MLSGESVPINAKAFRHLVGVNLELTQDRRSKTGAQSAIHGITSPRHDNTPGTRLIVARVKCVPARSFRPAQEYL